MTEEALGNHGQIKGVMGVIRVFYQGKLQREFHLGAKPLVIGRSPECDIVIPDSSIGRRHAKLFLKNGVAVVKDLGSANGVQVAGRTISSCEIQSQEQFSILDYQFKFLNASDYNAEQHGKSRPDTRVGGTGVDSGNLLKAAGVGAAGNYYYGATAGAGPFADGTTILAEVIAIARERWKLISASLFVALLMGLLHGFLAVPTFETNALVQVEPKIRDIGGPFSDVDDGRRVNDALIDEVQVIQSRSVLGDVVDNLGLSIQASPTYFPYVGAAVARRRSSGDGVAEPLFGLRRFAWSNEDIVVDSMEIPDKYLWQQFTVVAGGNGAFKVVDADGNTLARGNVGEPLLGWLPGNDPSSLFISELNSNAGTVFKLRKIPRLAAIAKLRDSLGTTDAGIQSSILRVSLTGADAQKIVDVVNNILTSYVTRNVRQQSEDARRTLQFVEQQIPIAREKMESAESKLNELRMERGSVDISSDTQVVLDKIVRIESQLSELQGSRAELIERFMPQHPRIQSLDAQVENLKHELAAAESEVRELPTTQREVLTISREVAVASELYVNLVNRAQELQVVSAYAATTGNVRIVDYASLPLAPFRPNKQYLLVIYLVIGFLFGTGLILFQRQLRNVVRDPDLIESRLNLPIYASLSHSSFQDTLRNQASGAGRQILALASPNDAAIEAIRSLRTSLQFAFVNSDNNILLISGPTARIGKTFVAANLAAVLAASGRSVVVVDADLRRGTMHEQFGLSREPGLADAIGGELSLVEVAHKTDIDGLHVVSAGAIPPNPSELLMHERFVTQLHELSVRFDHVIIDSPPILAVTDPALVSRLAGVVLLVVKCGAHPMREIEQTAKQLLRVGANLRGVVFNDIPLAADNPYIYARGYDHVSKYGSE